jgi:hypothetical protein
VDRIGTLPRGIAKPSLLWRIAKSAIIALISFFTGTFNASKRLYPHKGDVLNDIEIYFGSLYADTYGLRYICHFPSPFASTAG